jgi:hypothetical protein
VASGVTGKRLTVKWYGGGTRRIQVITGTGHWYRQGQGLVQLRWIHVRDLTGSHRDEYFFSTEIRMSVKRIVEAFVGRWDIEVTFEEMREHLGLETTRGRCRNTVLRVEPCLFCLYALIVYCDHLPEGARSFTVEFAVLRRGTDRSIRRFASFLSGCPWRDDALRG